MGTVDILDGRFRFVVSTDILSICRYSSETSGDFTVWLTEIRSAMS